MNRLTVLIIRHAEKPAVGGDSGIDSAGSPDSRSLTPRGWQRAGAWMALFMPAFEQRPVLPRPTAVFASALARHRDLENGVGGKSRRPMETVMAFAAAVPLEIDMRFTKGMEGELAEAISKMEGVVLVCWQHENIAAIARALAPGERAIPDGWPADRFNIVFRLDRAGARSRWTFEQIAPLMLAGDKSDPI